MTYSLTLQNKFRLALHSALLVFLGICIAVGLYSKPALEVFVSGVVSMMACFYLLRSLPEITPRNVAAWLVLCLFFLLYFVRYAYFSFDPTPIAATHPDMVFMLLKSDWAGLQRSFTLSAFVFSIFCIVSALLIKWSHAPATVKAKVSSDLNSSEAGKITGIFLLGLPVLMLVLGYVAYKYHIGQMGVPPGEPLPFRLKGIIFYARLILLPLLILTLIYLGSKANNSWIERAGLFLLLAHGVSDMMLRGSRSSLLLCILLALFLAANGGLKLKRNGMLISSLLLLGAVVLMPIIMNYRILRFTSNEGLLIVMGQAISATGESLLQLLLKGLSVVYFRIPGIETIWAILSVKAEPLGSALIPVLISPFGITGHLNFTTYQLSPELNTLFAPGFVGWLYLAGGVAGLAIGSLVLAWICIMLPIYFYKSGLRSAPVANTFLLWILFVSLTDGTLDSNLFMIAVGVFSLGSIELLLRTLQKYAAAMSR